MRSGSGFRPVYHMIRAIINTEVIPVVGTEKQGEEFIRFLTEEFEKTRNRSGRRILWETLHDLVKEGSRPN